MPAAKGDFEVKVAPVAAPHGGEGGGAPLGRLTLDKTFHGGLEATSMGEMLSAGNPANGSAGYVAIEKVVGKLDGRSGSFVLQHSGTMKRGVMDLRVTVVPDSGMDQLSGLEGSMTIHVGGGKHSYEFDYTLPA